MLYHGSFVRNLKRFTTRCGCPTYIISDGGKNFVFLETREFVSRLGTEWKINLPLLPRQTGLSETLVRSMKTLLGMELGNLELGYVQLQTILLRIETILNNRALTYSYADENESCFNNEPHVIWTSFEIM